MEPLARQLVRHHRAIGTASRRRRVPRQIPPITIEREYAHALLGLLVRTRSALSPLLAELPELLASAQRERADSFRDSRSDAGEGRRIGQLADEARERIGSSVITPGELQELALKIAGRVAVHNATQLNRQIRAALGVDVLGSDRRLGPIVDGFVSENVALIKNISTKVADDIGAAALRAVTEGTLHKNLAKEIGERFGMAANRSRLIARDQVGKLYGQINIARQRELGGDRFIWRSSNDSRVRPSHQALDGQSFKYTDPPSEGFPGQPVLCRCTAEPDFDAILENL